MKNTRHLISSVFITLLLSFKVLGLHPLTHEESQKEVHHCTLCNITSSVNLEPLLFSEIDTISHPLLDFDSNNDKIVSRLLVYYHNNQGRLLSIRPPPSTL